MEFQDYYATLGVERDASAEDIRKAYRRLALKWHPDRHEGSEAQADAEARFKRISEAYAVLSDAEQRAEYDQLGRGWQQGQEFTPPGGARTMTPEEFEELFGERGGFSDFFQGLFGERLRRAAASGGARPHARFRMRGADVRGELALAVGDALRGGKRTFEFPATAACSTCGGEGFAAGRVCPACAGVGRVQRTRRVELEIPKDVRDGLVLRLAGLGEPGVEGGEPGDLLLTLRLRSDAKFRIDGADVDADVHVPPWVAVFGGRVDVRTPGGTATVTIPAGTKAGRRLRLPGMGFPRPKRARGDFHAVVRLALPETLTEEQRDLLRRLRDVSERPGGAPVESEVQP